MSHSIGSALQGFQRQSGLFWSLTARDIESRYRGTLLGLSWLLIYPLLMLGVYAFVFGGIYQSRWLHQGSILEFVTMLYCGLIVHGLFAEVLSRAPSAVSSQPNFVKKVVFPVQMLPIVQLGTATFNACLGVGILLVLMALQLKLPNWTGLYLPLVMLPLLLLSAGVAWLLASVGVFLRDLGQITTVLTSVMLFLSPVFYPSEAAPEAAKAFLYLNPLTYPIEELRNVLIIGRTPQWSHLALYSLVSLMTFVVGLWFFQRSRNAFADVI